MKFRKNPIFTGRQIKIETVLTYKSAVHSVGSFTSQMIEGMSVYLKDEWVNESCIKRGNKEVFEQESEWMWPY